MHNRLVLNNTNMAYRAASLSVFPNLPWLAWFKRIVCPLTRTMIATGLLVNLLWPPWHIVDPMSVCRVMYVRYGWLPSGPWYWYEVGPVNRSPVRGRERSRTKGKHA